MTATYLKIVRHSQASAMFLLRFYYIGEYPNDTMKEYVEENLDQLHKRADAQTVQELNTDCWKLTFDSEKEANEALHEIRMQHTPGKKPIRSYHCPLCRNWHHTSMPLKKYLDNQLRHKRMRA